MYRLLNVNVSMISLFNVVYIFVFIKSNPILMMHVIFYSLRNKNYIDVLLCW